MFSSSSCIGEAVDDKPELPSKPASKWKALDDSATMALPSRRKVGWPKGVKRGPRKEKVPSENETVEVSKIISIHIHLTLVILLS